MGKEYTHTFWLITSLILNGFSIRKKFWKAETESFPTITIKFYVCRSMSKMSKIDQIHLRAVMLCMLKMSKIDQIHLRAVMLCYVC